ncbi:hypothetical protein PIB30_007438 [Stylosanthes scabra]|uniref:Uncharacterized protein n=1 Tax=Stylosanthes scabra TaxID=79078 RepID=A0ABU6R548_9FABA|nr:hypothetical protein [Stylosanthes scabra]
MAESFLFSVAQSLIGKLASPAYEAALFNSLELALDSSTKDFVASFAANGDEFQKSFADAMVNMGRLRFWSGMKERFTKIVGPLIK